MSAVRASGYPRRERETYPTPPDVTRTIVPYLRELAIASLWEPAPESNDGLANVLRGEGFAVVSTSDNFLIAAPPTDNIDCILTNPPFGKSKKGEKAEAFIRHARALTAIRHTIFLLPLDFDSAVTRQSLFRENPAFACQLKIIHRIIWFADGTKEPSTHHAWFHFDRQHVGRPTIRYVINQQPRRSGPR